MKWNYKIISINTKNVHMKELFKGIKNAVVVLSLTVFALNVNAQSNSTMNGLDVECLGVEMDGSQTLRAMGTGRKKSDAVEQAKKNAVNAVLFTGINAGLNMCDVRPLVSEVNARDKYEDYFNAFFKDGGEYLKYVSMKDKKFFSNSKKKDKIGATYRITVRVLRSQLKLKLREDGILSNNY